MDIIFADKNLKKYANDDRLADKKLGAKRAKYFRQRLKDLSNAETYADLEYLPGNFHPLKNNRKGQWACDLDQPYRLVFEPVENPIPTDKDGKYILIEIKTVDVLEITNYHKEG